MKFPSKKFRRQSTLFLRYAGCVGLSQWVVKDINCYSFFLAHLVTIIIIVIVIVVIVIVVIVVIVIVIVVIVIIVIVIAVIIIQW